MQEEFENIDISEWLPEPPSKLYPRRDVVLIDGNTKSIAGLLGIDILLDRGVITGEHHRTAMFVFMTRRARAKSLGLEKVFHSMRMFYDEQVAASVSPDTLLRKATSGLKPYEHNLVDLVTQLPRGSYDRHRTMTINDVHWIGNCVTSLRTTLEKVQKNIDVCLKNAKNDSTQDSTVAS